jgi:hypothetical protein
LLWDLADELTAISQPGGSDVPFQWGDEWRLRQNFMSFIKLIQCITMVLGGHDGDRTHNQLTHSQFITVTSSRSGVNRQTALIIEPFQVGRACILSTCVAEHFVPPAFPYNENN